MDPTSEAEASSDEGGLSPTLCPSRRKFKFRRSVSTPISNNKNNSDNINNRNMDDDGESPGPTRKKFKFRRSAASLVNNDNNANIDDHAADNTNDNEDNPGLTRRIFKFRRSAAASLVVNNDNNANDNNTDDDEDNNNNNINNTNNNTNNNNNLQDEDNTHVDHNQSLTENLTELVNTHKRSRVYLLTYSQANLQLFPTRESFGRAVVQSFGGNRVSWLAVCIEKHRNGGVHYHAAVRLSTAAGWTAAKKYLTEQYNVVVNFKESPDGGFYNRVFTYISKEDPTPKMMGILEAHPDKDDLKCVAAERANEAYRRNRASTRAATAAAAAGPSKGKASKKKEEPPRLTLLNVGMIIRERNIRSELELFATAEELRKSDDGQMALLLMRIGEKRRKELLADAWRLADAQRQIRLRSTSRKELLVAHHSTPSNCVCPSFAMWFTLAIDLCVKNSIKWEEVGSALYDCIVGGRKKHKNILIAGQADCGKTFLLEPLKLVFEHILNSPPSSVFGWLGVEKAQIIYLNDFRWINPVTNKQGIITWDAFLRLLDGTSCTLPAPMNSHNKHIEISNENDIPILCTTIDEIRYYEKHLDEPQTEKHHHENDMMKQRWNVIKLSHRIPKDQKADIEPCGWCFCNFLCSGKKD